MPQFGIIASGLLITLIISLSWLVTHSNPVYTAAAVVALATVLVTFVNPTLGLFGLIVGTLFSPEIKIFGTGERAATFRMEDVLLLSVCVCWFAQRAVQKPIGLFKKTPLNNAIMTYGFLAIISSIIGIMMGPIRPLVCAAYLLKYLEYFLLFTMVVNQVKTETHVKIFVSALLVTAVTMAVFLYAEIGYQRVAASFIYRPIGDEPGTIGGYYVFILALILGLLVYTKSWALGLAYVGSIMVIIPPFLYTLSRGSYLGLLGALVTLFVIGRGKRIALILLYTAFVVISTKMIPLEVANRIMSTFSAQGGGITVRVMGFDIPLEPSAAARVGVYEGQMMRALKSNPLFGGGVSWASVVDSHYARVMIETGFLGMAAFIYMILRILKSGWKATQTDVRWIKGLATGFVAGTVGLLFHGFSAATFILIRIMEVFWFMTALIVLLPAMSFEPAKPELASP